MTDDLSSIIPFGRSSEKPVSLTQALQGIRKAKHNPNIKGIYLNVENLSAGLASTDDLREALVDFKKSGKFIIAYADGYSQKAYYLSLRSRPNSTQPRGDDSPSRDGQSAP